MATHSSILAGKIPWTEEPGGLLACYSPWGRKELGTTERLSVSTHTHTHTHTPDWVRKSWWAEVTTTKRLLVNPSSDITHSNNKLFK